MNPTPHAEAVKLGVLDRHVPHEAQPAPYYRTSTVLTGGSHPVEPISSPRDIGVMAETLLGQDTAGQIDIHSGGEDNIFPHHECEIAQTRCASGERYFARYWFHTRYLTVEGSKMSKSAGNFYTLDDMLQRGASPAAVRLELTKTHYRQNSNYTFQGLRDSQRRVERWHRLEEALRAGTASASESTPLQDAVGPFRDALSDDLNVAGAIGALDQAVGSYTVDAAAGDGDEPELDALRTMLQTLGVLDLEREVPTGDADESAIDAKLAERTAARASKDWATSDRIRDELIEMGIAIKDGSEGTTWTKIVQE
jgi:cysteinyl-tRNA synthetase